MDHCTKGGDPESDSGYYDLAHLIDGLLARRARRLQHVVLGVWVALALNVLLLLYACTVLSAADARFTGYEAVLRPLLGVRTDAVLRRYCRWFPTDCVPLA